LEEAVGLLYDRLRDGDDNVGRIELAQRYDLRRGTENTMMMKNSRSIKEKQRLRQII
jgi:hypothetical protein